MLELGFCISSVFLEVKDDPISEILRIFSHLIEVYENQLGI